MIYKKDSIDNEVLHWGQFWTKYALTYGDAALARSQFDKLETVPVMYDSEVDTLKHIKRVSELLTDTAIEFLERGKIHDDSKLESPEKEGFDEYTPKLKGSTYGSDEYKQSLKGLGRSLTHHYENNSHHPEHYEKGIDGMDLFDLVEMFMDWKAATERHDNGDIYKSIEYNKGRFGMSDQLCSILTNTAKKLNWEK